MALQYITVPIKDLGAGIDQLSAENAIPEGFSEDLLNADPKPEGYLVKRVGYQGFSGFVPLRVNRLEYTTDSTNNICFYLDSSINLSNIQSTPIIVYGRTSAPESGDYTDTDSVHYYPAFTSDVRQTFNTGINTLSLPNSGTSDFLWAGVASSDNPLNQSNTVFLPDEVRIDQSNQTVEVDYTNGTGAAFTGFVYLKDNGTVPGSSYISAPFTFAPGTSSQTILATTHSLTNFNILTKTFVNNGTQYVEILPDQVLIDTSGNVTFTLTNGTGSPLTVVFSLSVPGIGNVQTGSVASGDSTSITISNLQTPFLFVACYLEQTLGGTKELVLPDNIAVDTVANTATVSFTNGTGAAANFFLFYEFATIGSNKLCVTGPTISPGYTDSSPQLTLWGLDQSKIYNTISPRGGWVTHLDSYRSVGENRLISGLGGSLFENRSIDAAGAQYLLPIVYPDINNRVSATTVIGPAFYDSTDTPGRTRGYVQFNGGNGGEAQGTAAQWDSSNGWIKYTLSIPSSSITGTLSTIISSTTDLEDYLTIEQAGYKVNEGTFKIKQVTNPSTDVLCIWVENTDRADADWDETDSGMSCGIFTDRVPLTATSSFLPDDRVSSEIFTASDSLTVQSTVGSELVLEGVTSQFTLPLGLRLAGERSSFLMPIRDFTGISSVDNLVAGDMISYSEIERLLRVVSINSDGDRAVTISGDGTTATVTLASGDTSAIGMDKRVLFYQAGSFTGVQQVTTVTSLTTFTFSSSVVVTGQAGTLKGHTIELDEELDLRDTIDSSVFLRVESRWIPIEAPDDNWDLTPSTHYTYFNEAPYDNQTFLRSVMVADNMYLTNGQDEVLKYDGVNLYRAGLFRWQPHLFLATDTNPPAPNTGKVTITEISCPFTTFSNNHFTVSIADSVTFLVGATIHSDVDDTQYVVTETSDDGTDGFVTVDTNITGTPGAGNLAQVNLFNYYFRLNAVDVNDNIIASAVTGSQDFRVQLNESSQVRMRLLGLPVWDLYDYDRLEVEVYRTKLNGAAPYYKLATIPMQFNNGQGYIDYTDTDADEVLRDLDIVNTALLGQELGQRWSQPLSAKYITSSGNSLILGNLKSDPTLDIQMVDTGIRITPSVLSNNIWTFRKDNTDTLSTTDMVNRALYEWVTSFSGTVSTITSSPTDFTVTTGANHGLSPGDWVYLCRDAPADGNSIQYMGWFQVNNVPTLTTFVVKDDKNYGTSGASDVNQWVKATDSRNIPVYLGTDGNYAMADGNTDSTILAYEFTALRRLANAINASMRKVDVTISGMEQFSPWMIANAGNEYAFGQMVITQPKIIDTFLEVQVPSFTGFNLFINSVQRDPTEQVSAITRLYPSRLLVSYPNYPEIMDNPTAILDTDSQSAIDVNPADGQEITGIIPFFGASSFGAALQDGVIVVFKQNSIYLVSLAAKAAGQDPVQRIESQGLGCTAPYSIAPTQDGIMFANESGLYKLARAIQIDYLGRRLERIWRSSVDRTRLEDMHGHYYANGNSYKVSVPYITDASPDKVFVYNTVREYKAGKILAPSPSLTASGLPRQDLGSWTRYDNHPAIGWANLLTDAYFASTIGQVFSIRRVGDVTDYRDDASPIAMDALLPAMSFGDDSIRKAVGAVIVQYRTIADATGIELYSAPNLTEQFELLDPVTINIPQDSQDSLSDSAAVKVLPVRYSIDFRKAVYIQLRFKNANIDEPVEIASVYFRVAGLTEKGITEAAGT